MSCLPNEKTAARKIPFSAGFHFGRLRAIQGARSRAAMGGLVAIGLNMWNSENLFAQETDVY